MENTENYGINEVRTVLTEAKLVGEDLVCVFQCPQTKKEFKTSINTSKSKGNAFMGKASKQMKVNLMRVMKAQMLKTVSRVAGRGAVGQIARAVGSSVLSSAESGMKSAPSPKDKDIVNAFRSVQENFTWDDENKTFIAKDNAHEVLDFTSELSNNPITKKDDLDILARLLAQLANSDGDVSEDEKEMFSTFITEENGSIESLLEGGDLDDEEILRVSPNVRESIMMILWAVALADDELANNEKIFIKSIASTWEIKREKLEILKLTAARYMIGQVLSADSKNEEVHKIAQSMAKSVQLPNEELEHLVKIAAQ